jgi:aryl-alcohol dehydrogenase-like predicted oxidoreductase
LLLGAASVEGTRCYAQRAIDQGLPATAYRPLGRTGLVASSLGFGSYGIDDRTPEHAAALRQAIRRGVNLIDTSANYGDGASESCIGSVITGPEREELIVVSKAGFLQGQALAKARMREQCGLGFPEMVKYNDRCWHCIHPEFLAQQLGESLERLRVEKLDIYLLHNPEHFFMNASRSRNHASLEALRDQFYDRVKHAFSHLEDEVRRGRIGFYGVSSNMFNVAASNPNAISLERIWTIAGKVAHEHHFAVVQMPANLFESCAMMRRNSIIGNRTILEFAREHDLAVLINRPLNAFYGELVVRLADEPVLSVSLTREIHSRVNFFLPPAYRTESLSRKAIAVLMNTEGITCVLNGMRRLNYVEDSLGALRGAPFVVDIQLYETLNHI